LTKQIRLNAFDMNCIGHIQHGMWTHPRDRSASYNTIEYWQDLARTAERGLFDGIFLADIVGVYDVYKDSPAPSILNTVQIPVNDPMLVVPVMAAVTKHIGFGVTSNLTYEPPYLFARRTSTLDHLTGGRFGWNIVTGYLDSAARGMGLTSQLDHDGRYDIADEYMDVVYKLWEGSWEDDAVLRDRANRVFADPSRIHRIQHAGPHYQVDAIHLAEPSPQRTPVLYQAGSSTRGREFAAKHAECYSSTDRTRRTHAWWSVIFEAAPRRMGETRTKSSFFSAEPLSWDERVRRPRTSTRSIIGTRVSKVRWHIFPVPVASTCRDMIWMNRSVTRRMMPTTQR
jgi:FMN-dependent oxidoreductase (nitrilotriacetate monooxygenase family)